MNQVNNEKNATCYNCFLICYFPYPQASDVKDLAESDLPSLSLTELEEEKATLLQALVDNNSSNKTPEDNSKEPVNNDILSALSDGNILKNEEKLKSVEEIVDFDIIEDDTVKETDNNLSPMPSIKTSSFGTPILKSSSPYAQLPNMDNFTKNVSPVINFENLPNTTGKYEQLKTEVLQKVRNKMKHLQNCKS